MMRAVKILEILAFFLTTRSSSKIINAAITGNFSRRQVTNTLQYLRKKGFVSYDGSVWSVTEEGERFYREKGGKMVFRYFHREEKKEEGKKRKGKRKIFSFYLISRKKSVENETGFVHS